MGIAAAKVKRKSVSSLLFGAQKEMSFLIPPQLLLKQLVGGKGGRESVKVVEHALQLSSKSANSTTPPILPALVTALFGGPVLAMNTLNAKESEAVLTAAAQARRAEAAAAAAAHASDPKRSGPAGPPPAPPAEGEEEGARVIDDADATVRELRATHAPHPTKQVSTFYTVVTARWLRQRQAQESAAAANALAAKDKGAKKGRKSMVAGAEGTTGTTEEEAGSAEDNAMQLIAVSGAMQHTDLVRWDVEHNLCALVQTGSAAITILRLVTSAPTFEDNGVPQLSMEPLCAVDLSGSALPHRLLTSVTWWGGVLYSTAATSASMRATFLSNTHPIDGEKSAGESKICTADTFELPSFSMVSALIGLRFRFAVTVMILMLFTVSCSTGRPRRVLAPLWEETTTAPRQPHCFPPPACWESTMRRCSP
jgi:hypothetical protein